MIQPNNAGTTTYGYWDNNVAEQASLVSCARPNGAGIPRLTVIGWNVGGVREPAAPGPYGCRDAVMDSCSGKASGSAMAAQFQIS